MTLCIIMYDHNLTTKLISAAWVSETDPLASLVLLSIQRCRNDSKKAYGERDQEGCTPLLVAAKNGDEDSFSSLLQHVLQFKVNKTKGLILMILQHSLY